MTHLTEEQLYNIAYVTEETQPYNTEEIEQMNHLKKCKECYERFCAALVLAEVTSESGYAFLSDMRAVKDDCKVAFSATDKFIAVIDVIRNKAESVLEQVEQIGNVFNFVMSPAFATRGAEDGNLISRLEDVEDDKTFILFDSAKSELLIQINTKNISQTDFEVYIKFGNENIVEVPTTRKGNLVKGILKDVPDKNFKIYIKDI